MPRPAPDSDEIRARMLDLAEAQLAASGGRRLILSDIAAEMGMSQSNAHRYFATKRDLIRALAERWFAEVETGVAWAAAQAAAPEQGLRAVLLTTLRLKRARFEADPVLFRAYLTLAQDHMDLVSAHTSALSDISRGLVARMVAPDRVDGALALFEDATVAFRVPAMIAARPRAATENRARVVLDAILPALR